MYANSKKIIFSAMMLVSISLTLSGCGGDSGNNCSLAGLSALSLPLSGCWGDSGGSSATPDTTPPTVSSTNHANNATNVAVNSAVTATFSEAMSAATITPATFTLNNGATGTVSYTGTTATFTPASNLAYSTAYTATITTGAKDSAGNALAANYTWSFTTGTAPDTTPPAVSATTPTSNAAGVAVNSALTATFSETMDASTITTATFTLNNGATGTVTYTGTTATFTPASNLAYSTAYTATITTGAKDSAGNAMAGNYTWSFTTQPSSGDTVAPIFGGLNIAVPSAVGGNVTLSWYPATDNITASNAIVYDISVATNAGAPFAATYTTAAGATNFTATGLTAQIDYYFVVRARDEAGNRDANIVEALTHELMGSMQLRGTPLSVQPGGIQFTYFDTCYIHTLDFGDGSSYTGNCIADQGDVIVNHQYAAAGTYTVTLTNQTGQSESITLTITPAAGTWATSSELTIGASATSGGTWSGGNPDIFTPNTPGATVSVTEIEARLNGGTSVTIATSPAVSGDGDILVINAVSWGANALTLNAERDIKINAVMAASGSSSLVMNTGTAVYGGVVKAGINAGSFIGRVDFPGRSGTGFLTILGGDYTVINDVTALQGMCIFNTCRYALGSNIDASATSGWNGGLGFAPVGTGPAASFAAFYGRFDGLGHAITGLTINRPAADYVGLFGFTNGAKIANVGLINGSVSGHDYVGGLVGQAWTGSDWISNSYNTNSVTGSATSTGYVGGLVGYHYGGTISNSYNAGTISGAIIVGGLTGKGGAISNSYNTGTVTGTGGEVGGLTGEGGGISNSYNSGGVNGNDSVGGLVGYQTGNITNSYSIGSVSGSTNIGGVVGYISGGTFTSSYLDTNTSGKSNCAGFGSNAGCAVLATAQMKQRASFSAWDFANIWRIDEGVSYPTLLIFQTP